MNTESFFARLNIRENPFRAEEARDDVVFQRLIDRGQPHPEFDKIFGDPAHPGPSVVFGEKGSGKTAIRLQMVRKLTDRGLMLVSEGPSTTSTTHARWPSSSSTTT